MSSNQKKNNEFSEARNSVSPQSSISKQKNSEKSKDLINNDLKVLSDHIALQSKKSSLANGNLENIFNNIFTKDQEIQNLNNRESIIHHLDFLGQEQPVKKAKQKTPFTYKKTQSVFISPIRKSSDGMNKIGLEFSLTPNKQSFANEKNTSLLNNNINKGSLPVFSLAGALKENENFSSGNHNSNRNESKNNTEFNKKVFKIGLNNSMRIKRSKVRSLENNPRKMRIYEKGLFHLQKKDLEINMIRNKLNKASTSKLKDKPEMNKNSQKIMQTKFADKKPIFKRADEIIESKNNTIHKLKKYHINNEENSKWADFSLNQDKSQIENLTHLDNFEYSHFSKNHAVNSVKNTSSNFNNKFFNLTKTPNSGKGNLLKMINDTNNDIGNISAINSLHQNSENKKKKNDANYSHKGYLDFMNKNQNKKTNKEEENKFKNFEHDEFIPFDIQYQQRTMEWIKNKEIWDQKKKEKIEINKKIAENDDLPENRGYCFKPKVNKNSEKIMSSKRALSQSTLSNYNDNENNNFDHMIDDNLSNLNNSIFSGAKGKTKKNYSVYENLYSKRFDTAIKREKIMQDTMCDFTPKINQAIKYNKNQESITKKNLIPNSKKNGFKKEKKIAGSVATLNKFSPDKIVMKKFNRVKELNEIEQEEKYAKKKREQDLFDKFDEVDKENKINENKMLKNNGRASVDIGQLYKLNIRSASAWDLNKENNAYSNDKFAKIVSKVGSIKF